MLSPAENDLLTRVGPRTPMGNLMRRFWQPFALSTELAGDAGAELPVRLLGENLVAVRGRAAPREASPWRERESGRGGEAITVSGPSGEPDARSPQERSYPVRDLGGLLWTYLGPAEGMPAPPALEFTHVPPSHRYVTKRIQLCNFLQNVEGEVDSSHVSFLHSKATAPAASAGLKDPVLGLPDYMDRDRAPRFFVLPTEYGLLIGARRDAESDTYYWRITQFLMPSYTMIPAPVSLPVSFTGATPIDDTRMMGFTVTWHGERPLSEAEIAQIESWTGVHTEVDPKTFIPLRNKDNDYLIDRALQRSGRSYTGIRGIREEDLAVQESMGEIYDRSLEHLGSADLAVIAMRRRLLEAVNALAEQGELPYEAQRPDAYRVRSAALVLPREVIWNEGAASALVATA